MNGKKTFKEKIRQNLLKHTSNKGQEDVENHYYQLPEGKWHIQEHYKPFCYCLLFVFYTKNIVSKMFGIMNNTCLARKNSMVISKVLSLIPHPL